MEEYKSENDYLSALERRASLPQGFECATSFIDFYPVEKPVAHPYRMNLSLITVTEPTPYFAAMFTKNRFPGAPVLVGKQRLAEKTVRGVLVNNKVSNVCIPGGVEAAENLLEELGKQFKTTGKVFFPASTGIIGWQLPVKEMKTALPGLAAGLSPDSILPVARSIMTTDSYPKVRAAMCRNQGASGLITGTAKGAGMIEPNLATMLVFILTDLYMEKDRLQEMLARCVKKTFNRISIDSDQSTSDTVILLSSGRTRIADEDEFEKGLLDVCTSLATDIIRNGEGTSHVMKVTVRGDGDESVLEQIGKAVVNSPLVKTAIFGNDPNVGRIASAVGDFLGNNHPELDTDRLSIRLGESLIFDRREFRIDAVKEKLLCEYLAHASLTGTKEKKYPSHDRFVDIEIATGPGATEATIYGSDLSYEYVRENADYRS